MTKEGIVGNKLKSNLNYCASHRVKNIGIIQQIASVANLKLAWYKVRKNPYILTFDNKLWRQMLVSENEDWFYTVSKKLLNSQYKYKKASAITILKKNGTFYGLKIVSFGDVVVQKAFFLALSGFFEKQNCFGIWYKKIHKKFLTFKRSEEKLNHTATLYQSSNSCFDFQDGKTVSLNNFLLGFRQKKSVHSVMQAIKVNWNLLNYFVTCNMDKVFDRVNCSILMKGLEEYIKDKKVCNEIWKMLNCQGVNFKVSAAEFNSLSTPQGSVLSPFLFDVYMVKFDRFVESLIASGLTELKNPFKAQNLFLNKIKYYGLNKEPLKSAKTYNVNSGRFVKMGCQLLYIRHMNDFLIGYFGKKMHIKEALKRIEIFIKFNLRLNFIGFKLINAYSDYVNYLGFRLKCSKKKVPIKSRWMSAFNKLKNRLIMRKLIENRKYLKMLEWAGSKFYRKVVERVVCNPQQIFAKQGINLKNVLSCWGQRDGLIYLITALKQSLRSFNVVIESSNSLIVEPYYKMVEQLRENRYKEFIQWWSEAAKILAQTEIENEVKEFLPLKTVQAFDTARNNFLLQIDQFYKTKINLRLVKNLGLINYGTVSFLTKRMRLKGLNHLIKMHINVKNIMEQFKEQGIVNKKYCPICFKKICSFEDYQIINKMAIKAYALMHFYSCVDNLWHVKKLVDYILRYSLASTLARKFKISLKKIFQIYGRDLSVRIKFKKKIVKIASFPSKNAVDSIKCKFNAGIMSYGRLNQDLQNVPVKTAALACLDLFKTCGVFGCHLTNNVEIHHVKISMYSRKTNIVSFQNKGHTSANFCWKFLESIFCRRTIPLCHEHSIQLNSGFLTLSDLNFDFIIQPIRVLKSYSIA